MQALEITSYLEMLLRENIKLEDKKYQQIITGEVTGHLFYNADSVLLSQSYNDLQKTCKYIVFDLSNEINKKFGKKINDLNSEGFELLFKETNLHSSSVIGLSNNFIKLINWAQITFDFLDRYDKNNLNKDLENCLNVTFYENPEILQEVLLNHNIFDSEQQVKALEILDTLLEDKKEEYVRLNDLISKQIAFKASHYINNISYQHILKLQDKDFKIHRYDDMKKHHLFVNLF